MAPIQTRIFKEYKYRIFPKIKNFRGATRTLDTLEQIAQKGLNKIEKEEITPINELEWKNLIILDGARLDLYREEINPDTESRITAESHSEGFIQQNFSSRDWSDTVVIAANPFYNKEDFEKLTGSKPEDVFHTVFQVWETNWNTNHGTVMPEKMVEKARTAEKLFPEKRKIIHLMQPHYPFINSDLEVAGYGDAFGVQNETNVWEKCEKGELSRDEVVEAYKQNYKAVESGFNKIAESLEGKTILTSDHGNFLGENGLYGHPKGSKAKAVRKVPLDHL